MRVVSAAKGLVMTSRGSAIHARRVEAERHFGKRRKRDGREAA